MSHRSVATLVLCGLFLASASVVGQENKLLKKKKAHPAVQAQPVPPQPAGKITVVSGPPGTAPAATAQPAAPVATQVATPIVTTGEAVPPAPPPFATPPDLQFTILITPASSENMAKLPHDEDDIALPPSGSQYTTPRALVKEVGPEHLGNTFDSKFELVGKSIFPEAAVATTPLNSYNSETLIVEDKFTFDLNVRAWNIVSGAFGFLNDRRVVAIRNFQITDMLTIDDSAIPMQAPMNASYYLWRLYKGHMVEIIIQGDKSMFTAGVKSSILKGGVGIQYLKDHYGLSADINAQGAKPIDKESMFSLNVGDKVPLTTEGVEDVAIFAKYRLIPGRPLPKADPIEFEPYVFKSGKYSMNINNIVVRNTDSDGTFWDNGEASPEIYIKVYRKTADGFLELIFKTATVPAMNPVSDPDGISNLISANLNSKQSVTLSPDDILVLKVFDADDWWNPDDFVGECYTGPLNELQEDSMEISSCGQVDKIELEFSLKK